MFSPQYLTDPLLTEDTNVHIGLTWQPCKLLSNLNSDDNVCDCQLMIFQWDLTTKQFFFC